MNFDIKGLKFFFKFSVIVFGLIIFSHSGSTLLFNSMYVIQSDTSHIDKKLGEIKYARELAVREHLTEFGDQITPNSLFKYGLIDYIPEEGRIIAADLENMKIFLYEDGKKIDSLNILSKGREGSHWETPSGLYEILTLERNHFSSIGKVYMPYSMQFFGNFFIHGWPYYPDGTLVSRGFSGGCIRLSTESARKIFNFAEKGMKLFVYEEESKDSIPIATNIRNIPKPETTAKSIIVADINTGSIYYKKDSDVLLPIASITKFMTASVASETISFDKTVTVRDHAQYVGGFTGNIKDGDSFYVGDLMYPLLMESNNAVAHSLSDYYGDKQFISWMNKKARALGMYDTSFTDASGISSGNISTAEDLFRLAEYLYNKQEYILKTSREKSIAIQSQNGVDYVFHNFNLFSGSDSFVGGKTGFTNAAGETMISLFDIEDSTIAIIVLDSEDRESDITNIVNWFSVAVVPTGDEDSFSMDAFRYLRSSLIRNSERMLSSVISSF